MFKILMFLISVFVIENIHSLDTSTNCYKLYCYFWNGKAFNYSSLEPCPDGYWTLEIYNEEVQKEVDQFISGLIISRNPLSIKSYYVPLNINCSNKSNCTWKRKNEKAQHFNWGTFNANPATGVYYFQASNQTSKWHQMDHLHHTCVKVCMTEVRGAATEGNENENLRKDWIKDVGVKFYIILLVTSVVITPIILGIIVCFALRKKRSSIKADAKSLDTSAVLDEKVETPTKDNESSLYAQIEKHKSETIPNQSESLLQYADITFCSKISQNGTKSSDDQRSNYLGPMGDVYAAVQKP